MMTQKVLLLAAGLLVSSNSWAVIDVNPQLSMTGDNIKLTIPGNNRGGNVRFYIDMDNNPETGSTNQESALAGADYYIENDIIYAAAGDTWEYVSGDLISFSNEKENLELNINTTTFDTLANSTGLLNNEHKIDGFNGTIQMNVVTLDDSWNVLDSSGPTEYNILDIEIPVAAETEPAATTEPVIVETPTATPEQPAEPVVTEAPAAEPEQPGSSVVTETPSSETETNTEAESATNIANSNAAEEVTETKRERRKRLRKERRKAKRLERQARKKRQRERRQKRREERLAANRNNNQN